MDVERFKQERKTRWKVARCSAKIASVSDRPEARGLGDVLPEQGKSNFPESQALHGLFYLRTSVEQDTEASGSNLGDIRRVQRTSFVARFCDWACRALVLEDARGRKRGSVDELRPRERPSTPPSSSALHPGSVVGARKEGKKVDAGVSSKSSMKVSLPQTASISRLNT